MTPFRFILLSLVSYRATRLLTQDEWPPVDWFRNAVQDRTGADSAWMTLITCAWCAGTYITAGVFLLDYYLHIPTLILTMVAAMCVVGLVGHWDSD